MNQAAVLVNANMCLIVEMPGVALFHLMGPSSAFSTACSRYLRGVTHADILRTRRELLHTTLRGLLETLRTFQAKARFCAVGFRDAVAFLK